MQHSMNLLPLCRVTRLDTPCTLDTPCPWAEERAPRPLREHNSNDRTNDCVRGSLMGEEEVKWSDGYESWVITDRSKPSPHRVPECPYPLPRAATVPATQQNNMGEINQFNFRESIPKPSCCPSIELNWMYVCMPVLTHMVVTNNRFAARDGQQDRGQRRDPFVALCLRCRKASPHQLMQRLEVQLTLQSQTQI